ncbi:MAG TPA: hypothetical protein VKE96_22820 [Vicinamibacterales bacterium]|nr:hypothetical protein [Vicinamibacterales bacterium]
MPVADVVILSAARTPIGRDGGSLKDIHPAELGAVAAKAAIERASLTPEAIDEVVIGHPIGCSGARIVVTLLHELERRGAKRGLATLCVSGGMGMALAIERCE